MLNVIDKGMLKAQFTGTAHVLFNKKLSELNPYELNSVIAQVVKNTIIKSAWEKANNSFYSSRRTVVYFSMEFLPGRLGDDALINTSTKEIVSEIFAEEGIDINCLQDIDDAALGNGGLGRLSSCFLESAATTGYPVCGEGLYYMNGLFKQTFSGDMQVEVPDNWTAHGEPWFEPHYDEAVIVEFNDTKVKAVPYVMPIIGYNTSHDAINSNVFPMTIWKAEPIEGVTNYHASKISDYLYPNDRTEDGQKLRIRQEYFFVSAALQRIFKVHLQKHGTLDNIEDYYFFQMNDTHPVFASLEFIRLLKKNGYTFDKAFEKAKKCFAYTNHTIMSEALEKWPIEFIKGMLPDIYKVIEELNQKLIDELIAMKEFHYGNTFAGDVKWDEVREYEFFDHQKVYMSKIACYVAGKINGVAAVHTEIIENQTLKEWYKLYPKKFNNKTNGVTPRRWIKLANPWLSDFLDSYLGNSWITKLDELENLEKFENDPVALQAFMEVKKQAKEALAEYIQDHEGITIDVDSILDCQVKRIHEYKRQLMNALRILYIYSQLKKGNLPNFYKTTFIIGGKAASSYATAKRIIALIKDIQKMVNNDSDVNDKMQVVFLTNFNVSYAERVYAGANFSEQISTAGTEASGTSNMKFMMNGAPTIGTMDGANIEIAEEAGSKNNYIFGATVEEFKRISSIYDHRRFLDAHRELEELITFLEGHGNLSGRYDDLAYILRHSDNYFVMYDLESYIEATLKANEDYAMEQRTGDLSFYTQKSFRNTAHSGKFSSDRTIQEYAEDIWYIEMVN